MKLEASVRLKRRAFCFQAKAANRAATDNLSHQRALRMSWREYGTPCDNRPGRRRLFYRIRKVGLTVCFDTSVEIGLPRRHVAGGGFLVSPDNTSVGYVCRARSQGKLA